MIKSRAKEPITTPHPEKLPEFEPHIATILKKMNCILAQQIQLLQIQNEPSTLL